MNRYEKTIQNLTSSTKFHIKLGLERTKQFLELLGSPQSFFPVIHIAGTNGKGSTSAMLSTILTEAGYKTGLFTSPHIFDYTERIKINNVDISKEKFSEIIEEVCELAEKNKFELTEFETLTCAMFEFFAREKVDVAVVEVGLGGRLDSTNVVEKNLCSIITSISFDHTDRLGNSIQEIGFEKAGIIKEKNPVIIHPENSARSVIESFAKTKNSQVLLADDEVEIVFENEKNFALINGEKFEFSLMGIYQKENLALVVKTIEFLRKSGFEIGKKTFENSLKKMKWNARFQFIKSKKILIDASHNPAGAKMLKKSLEFYFPNIDKHWIYGSLTTKDFSAIMKILFDEKDEVSFYKFDYKNSCDVEILKKNSLVSGAEISIWEIQNLIRKAPCEKLLIFTGSFYMLDEIFKSCKELF